MHFTSSWIMILKMQHPFALIVSGSSSCGKPTFLIRLLECKKQIFDIVFKNVVCCHSENNAPYHMKNVSFVKGVPNFAISENLPTLVVLDDFMDTAYPTKENELLTKDCIIGILACF